MLVVKNMYSNCKRTWFSKSKSDEANMEHEKKMVANTRKKVKKQETTKKWNQQS